MRARVLESNGKVAWTQPVFAPSHKLRLIGALRRLQPGEEKVQEAVEQQIHYFQTNAERMRYAEFRRQGHLDADTKPHRREE